MTYGDQYPDYSACPHGLSRRKRECRVCYPRSQEEKAREQEEQAQFAREVEEFLERLERRAAEGERK